MKKRQIGAIIIIAGILIGIFTLLAKLREDRQIDIIIDELGGSCYLSDGTCLHQDRNYTLFILGGVIALSLILFGLYLAFADRSEELQEKQNAEVSHALKAAKETEKQKDEFNAFLSAFPDDQKKVLQAVREQDGIQQSTLRFRTGMAKTTLSLMLKDLEAKGIVARKPHGKTNEVYLRKKF